MRLLAIGDIHGYKVALEALLAQVNPTDLDQVVFLGDYVDKGPDVAGTLELLADLGHTICIDTGITKGKGITCIDLGDFSFTQASATGEIVIGKLRE